MFIEAFVIKKIPIREHDQLVVLYSREIGKCSVIAKGSLRAHSKQALALDDGNYIQCELVHGRACSIMTGAQAIRSYCGMKSSGVRLAAGQYALQIIDVLVYDHQPDERLWDCLMSASEMLDRAKDTDALTVFRDIQATFLNVLGYGSCPLHELDERFEQIAQRRLTALDLFYGMAARRIS